MADTDEMDVKDNDVEFEKEAESVFKIPFKRKKKKKNCGKAYEQVMKDGSSENMGSDSDKDCSNSNVSHCSNLSEFSK